MTCLRAFFALMRRNALYRRRHWLGTFLEILLPVGFVGVLLGIKYAVRNNPSFSSSTTEPAILPDESMTYSPLSFHDYVTALQAQRVCIAGSNELPASITDFLNSDAGQTATASFNLSSFLEEEFASDSSAATPPPFVMELLQGRQLEISGMPRSADWQVPLIRCNSRLCEREGQEAWTFCEYSIVGIAAATAPTTTTGPVANAPTTNSVAWQRAQEFQTWIQQQYPALESVVAQQITQRNNLTTTTPFSFLKLFETEQEMIDYMKDSRYGTSLSFPKLAMGIVWQGGDNDNADDEKLYSYTLRPNSTLFNIPEESARPATSTTPDTNRLFSFYAKTDTEVCEPVGGTPYLGKLGLSCTGQYMYNGVLTFQRLVHDFIMDRTTNGTAAVAQSGTRFVPFPTLPYRKNGFYQSLAAYGPLLIILGTLYPVASMISYICQEKELRQKELMKMMGVQERDIGWSWFISFFLLHGLLTASACAAICVPLYENSDPLLLWIYWVLTFTSFIVFCMMLASFTSKATRGVILGLLVFFVGVFLTLAVDFQTGGSFAISLISLHPVAAFSYGLQELGRLEDNGVGLQLISIVLTDSPSGYTFLQCILNLAFDSLLWGILTFIFNRVIPPDYGQALPIWFLFSPSYWCSGSCAKGPPPMPQEAQDGDNNDNKNIPNEPVGPAFQRQQQEGKTIEIYQLRKVFGEKAAVDGLNLSMYNGQITALLGHNGAGKTTTIGMLTGALAPTTGYATVAGKDIRTQMQAIRQNIGICLQHDCLFPNLTVREHLQFFSRLKGLYDGKVDDSNNNNNNNNQGNNNTRYQEAEKHISEVLQDVALYEKRNTYSKNLSGGMKRKLSLAIAFCGGSEVVLLDEPTSGMDPFSRRFTWNVIRQYRQNRCIILTTHFMDEADILGDRIAIMAEGELQCVGSSLFLKKYYGVGYQLTIEKVRAPTTTSIKKISTAKEKKSIKKKASKISTAKEKKSIKKKASHVSEDEEGEDGELELDSAVEIDYRLKGIVTGAVKEANLLTNVGSEMSFQLPVGASSEFPAMFKSLDREIKDKSISSYGVSLTTLEEVFLLVARGDDPLHDNYASSRGNGAAALIDNPDKSVRSRMDLENDGLFVRHLGALFRKRAAFFRRDKKAWCCTTVLPSLFVLLGFVIFNFAGAPRDLEPLQLKLSDQNANFALPGLDVKPLNPISYNVPDIPYTCQPGICAFQSPVMSVPETNEVYYYCGSQAFVAQDCIQSDSASFVERLVNEEQGVSAEPMLVSNIPESSISLSNTTDEFVATRYGAIYFTHTIGSPLGNGGLYNETAILTCQSRQGNYSSPCQSFGGIGYVIQYNFTSLHVAPLYQTLADEAIIREALDNNNFTIRTTIHPLPLTAEEDSLRDADDALLAWFLIVLSFPFISGAFASFVVAERESKAKHLQTVAGVDASAYWLSTYIWDVLNYLIPFAIAIALMFAFDVDVFTTTEQDVFYGVLVVMFLYGPASAGFTYCVSFAFTSPALCNMFIIISSFLVGMGGPLALFILTLIGSDPGNPQPNLKDAATIVSWVLRFIPAFNLGQGLFLAINIDFVNIFTASRPSVWTKDVMLYEVIFLGWQSILYVLLAIQLDKWSSNPTMLSYWRSFTRILTCRCFCGSKDRSGVDITVALPEDDDVLAEQDRVLKGEANNDLIVLSEMTKRYDNGKLAVNNLSLGIPPGQVFGLLGINGAGKTTTMQMLTAEFPPSSGDATLAGFSVTKQPEKIRRRIGYCPQFDAHFANLTGREHVELYASIKGIPRKFIKEAAEAKLKEVGLSEADSDRLSSGYSGGMKRRLSLACAMIGQPQIVFLDECSTGVDPVARREIWQLISDMVTGGNLPPEERTSVILTTHSMEECEALCPRIGIMANGRLRCLGSAQQLKNKFGQGFQVEMKVQIIAKEDEDYKANAVALARTKTEIKQQTDVEDAALEYEDMFFTLGEIQKVFKSMTGDDYLSNHVTVDSEIGYTLWKDATSATGATLDEVAAFCTAEMRMKGLADFMEETYPNKHVLRERQDSKARYEVSSDGVRLSSIFAKIEENKDRLRLADYGCSQTSLEQVFNSHAAEAEKLKQGRNDG